MNPQIGQYRGVANRGRNAVGKPGEAEKSHEGHASGAQPHETGEPHPMTGATHATMTHKGGGKFETRIHHEGGGEPETQQHGSASSAHAAMQDAFPGEQEPDGDESSPMDGMSGSMGEDGGY